MRQKGLEPDVTTYTAAISASDKAKQSEEAFRLLEEMRQKGLQPNVFMYCSHLCMC